MNDSKKLLKAVLGDQGYDTLEKAIFKQRTQAVIDPLEFYLPLIVAPRTVISWLVQTIKPMKTGEIKDVDFPGRPEIKIHFEKQDVDQYRAEFVSGGRVLHTFEKQSLPAASAHMMTVGELYEEYGEATSSDGKKEETKPALDEAKSEVPESYGMIRQMLSLSDIKAPQDAESVKWEMSHANVRELTAVIGKLVDSLTAKQMSRNKLEDELDKVSEKEVKDMQGKLESSKTPEEKAKQDAKAAAKQDNGISYQKLDQIEAKPLTEQEGPTPKVVPAGEEAAEGTIKAAWNEANPASMQAAKNISSPRMAGAQKERQDGIAPRMKADGIKKDDKSILPKLNGSNKEQGVHHGLDGTSFAGAQARWAHASPGHSESKNRMANAKNWHKETLERLKQMPKPNLPKAEMLAKPMDKAEMPKGAGQPKQPAMAQPPKPPVPPGNAPAAAAAKQAQAAGKGGYKPPQTPGAQKPLNSVNAKQNLAQKSPVKKAEYFKQKLGKAPMVKSEKLHLATEEQLYKSTCEDCGTAEFVKGPDGEPKFNPCACFRVLKNDEEGRPYRFVQPIKKSDGTFGLQFAKDADPEQVKLFLLTLKARLLIKKKHGI